MNAKLWIATAGLIAATSGWMWLRESDLAQPVVAEPASIDSALPAQVSQSSTTQPSNGSEREARIESVMESSPATQSPDEIPIVVKAKYEVRGRVLDSDGQAVDGLSVRLRGENNTAVTSGGGTFTIATSAQASTIEVADETWVTVRAGSWTHNAEIEPVVVIARAIELTGTVLDEWGSPVNGARVVIALPDNFETRFDHVIDASFSQEWSARTVDDGSFTMNRLPAISGAELRTVHDRFAPNVQDTPLSSSDLSIVLRRPLVPTEFALNGVVMHADGTTATEALVALGNTSVRSDKDGQFTIDLRQADDAQTLRAIETGHQPAILERPSKPSEDSSGWPNFVVLQLGPAALTIEGRVVDSDGKPLGGGRVWVGNSSRFGAVGKIPVRLEALMAGGAVPKEAVDSLAFDVSETDGGGTYGSARPLFEPDALVYWVVTDNNGRFELPGLTARDYTLHVLDTKLHWGTISDPIAAGSAGVEIVVPIEASYDVLRGQIVTEQGDGVPGVRITPWLGAVHMLEPVRGGDADVLRFFLGPSTTSDDEGLFELRGVPRRHVQFHIVSDEIVPSYASVEEVTDPDDFTITVLARIHIEVSVGPGPNSPNAFRVTDESGAVVTMLKMRADGYSHQEQVELTNGRSGVVTLTTDATMLDFLRDGLVVDSIPISPRPGQTLRINR